MVTMLMSLSLFEINNFTISTSISFVQIIITSKHIRQTIFMLNEVSFFLNNPSKPEIYLFSLEASLVKLKKLPVKYFVFRTRFVLNLNMLKGGGCLKIPSHQVILVREPQLIWDHYRPFIVCMKSNRQDAPSVMETSKGVFKRGRGGGGRSTLNILTEPMNPNLNHSF